MRHRQRLIAGATVSMACAWAAPCAHAVPAFRSGFVSWPVPPGAAAVIAGDCDGDGVPDLVAACANADSVVVLLLSRNGEPRSQAEYAAGDSPRAVLATDFDHDGALDLAAAGWGSNAIAILRGDGRGGFAPRQEFATGSHPAGLVAADFDRDGIADLATACEGDSTVSILFGRGDGSFPRRSILKSAGAPSEIHAGDLNRDGNPDLAVLEPHQVVLFFGSADGAFQRRADLPVEAATIALGDVNGDSDLDLVAVGGATLVYPGKGDGTFESGIRYRVGASALAQAVIAKIDDDKWPDLVIADRVPGRLKFLWGGASGPFEASSEIAGGLGPRTPVVDDLNGDGRTDVVVASGFSLVSVFEASGPRAFGHAVELADPSGVPAHAIAARDADRDGFDDLVTLNAFEQLVVRTAKGDGTFRPAITTSVVSSRAPMLLQDLDGDGVLDLVVAVPAPFPDPQRIVLQRGNLGGDFDAPLPVTTLDATSLAAGDVNGDGIPDLVVLGSTASVIALGRGNGRFEAVPWPQMGGRCVALADLDGDGNLDVVAAGPLASAFPGYVVMRGRGDGSFAFASRGTSAVEPSGIAVGDLDRDGFPDLVMTDAGRNQLTVNRGQGGLAFGPTEVHATAQRPVAVAIADFDEDGWLDAAAACAGSDVVTILGGDGHGFPVRRDFGTEDHPSAMTVGDFNADTLPDLATTDVEDGTVTVLLNSSQRTPVTIEDFTAQFVDGCVQVSWRLHDDSSGRVAALELERASSRLGPFTPVADWRNVNAWPDGYCDPAAAGGNETYYRLVASLAHGRTVIAGPVAVTLGPGGPVRLILQAARRGVGRRVIFPFEIAGRPSRVTPTIHDVRGRTLWSGPPVVLPPGHHAIEWDPHTMAGPGGAVRGVYFLRLSHPGGRATERFVVLDE